MVTNEELERLEGLAQQATQEWSAGYCGGGLTGGYQATGPYHKMANQYDQNEPRNKAECDKDFIAAVSPANVQWLIRELRKAHEALRMANDAMNYMGDILNGHDMAEPEDVAKVTPAFYAVRAAVGIST